MALAMLFMIGLSAMAQVTTGSVAGTVKDAQGGVVPGATVTLTSESKGTALSPTVTESEPETSSFHHSCRYGPPSESRCRPQDPEQTNVQVNPGSRAALGCWSWKSAAKVTINVKAKVR